MRQEVGDKFGVEVHQSAASSVGAISCGGVARGMRSSPRVFGAALIVLALVTLAGIAFSPARRPVRVRRRAAARRTPIRWRQHGDRAAAAAVAE